MNYIRYAAELELLSQRLHKFAEDLTIHNGASTHQRSMLMLRKFQRAWDDTTEHYQKARGKTPRPE